LEGARPDALALFRGQIGQAWYRERLRRRRPGFQAIDPQARVEPGVRPEQLGPLRRRLGSAGVLLAPDIQLPLAQVRARFDAVRRRAPDADSQRTLGLVHVQYALHHLSRPPAPGRNALVAYHLHAARAWAGADPLIDQIAARLNALDPAAGE
jgi:hypothetical protein